MNNFMELPQTKEARGERGKTLVDIRTGKQVKAFWTLSVRN